MIPTLYFDESIPQVIRGILQNALGTEQRLWMQKGDPTTGISGGHGECEEGYVYAKKDMRLWLPSVRTSVRELNVRLIEPQKLCLVRTAAGALLWKCEGYRPSYLWDKARVGYNLQGTSLWDVLARPTTPLLPSGKPRQIDDDGNEWVISFGTKSQAGRWRDKRVRFELVA